MTNEKNYDILEEKEIKGDMYKMADEKLLTVGIPAFKAESHICDALASIQIQSIKDKISIIIASDNPDDDYDFTKLRYPDLDITILSCTKNVGPGLARQRALDACTTPWITFIDADDIFIHPMSLEIMLGSVTENCIEVQGPFFQEIKEPNPQNARMMPRNDVTHPWVFGRMYNTSFLKTAEIGFSELNYNIFIFKLFYYENFF